MPALSLFYPVCFDYSKHSAIRQAKMILAQVALFHKAGYKKVGIIYSANYDQTQSIANAYAKGEWQTGIDGGNQAEVLNFVEGLLTSPSYEHLQHIFCILPITTCAQSGGVGAVEQEWLENDIKKINVFMQQDGSALLGWQNQNTQKNPKSPFAVGGGISQQLTAKQNEFIQKSLLTLQCNYPLDPSLIQQLSPPITLEPHLKIIEAKGKELKGRGYEAAAKAAEKLKHDLETAQKLYLKEPNQKESFNQFEKSCQKAIETSRKELAKHRGWNHVLGNILLAIVGLGAFYALACLINKATTGNYLFFSNTASSDMLDSISKKIPLCRQ